MLRRAPVPAPGRGFAGVCPCHNDRYGKYGARTDLNSYYDSIQYVATGGVLSPYTSETLGYVFVSVRANEMLMI